MADMTSRVLLPESLQELLAEKARNPEALIWAGGTGILSHQSKRYIALPERILSMSRIPETKSVTRTERFLELGSCVTLESLRELGNKLVPEVLLYMIPQIATMSIRNLATVGGNIAFPGRRLDLYPAFSCLDAHVELRKAQTSRWVAVSHLFDKQGKGIMTRDEIITRLRIPFETWDIQTARKCGFNRRPDESTATFCMLAKISRECVSDIRICMAGEFAIRDREAESALIGRKIPLSGRELEWYFNFWKQRLGAAGCVSSSWIERFIRLLERALEPISER